MLRSVFFNTEQHRLRSGWQLLVFAVLNFAYFLLYRLVAGRVDSVHFGASLARQVVSVPAVLALTALCTHWMWRQPLAAIGAGLTPGWWQRGLVGLGMGTTLMVGVAMVLSGSGAMRFSSGGRMDVLFLSLVIIGYVCSAAVEELWFRGFPLQAVAHSWGPLASAIVLSVIFAAAHLDNKGWSALSFFNTFLAGLWLCLAYFRTRSLWLPYGLHVGWNVTQNLLGLAVSGETRAGTALLQAVPAGPNWLTGGVYGPEASLVATLALVAGLVWVYRHTPRD